MTEWVDFAEIRAKVSLETVLFQFYRIDNLSRHGNKVVGHCPVHGGDSPRAFHADLGRNVWHCFTQCHRGGNQLDFVAAKEGISVREAALRLKAAFLDTGPPPSLPKQAPPSSPPPVDNTPAPPTPTVPTGTNEHRKPRKGARAAGDSNPPLTISLTLKPDHPHLTKTRGLAAATIQHFGVGYCAKGIMRGCIAIPVHDHEGKLVAYAGRHLRPSDAREFGKYKFPTGFRKELVLYNLHRASPLAGDKGLILVEGFFAVMKLHEAGFQNVVACMGCDLSERQAALLADFKEVLVLFDGDPAGIQGADKAVERLESKVTVRVARLPKGLQPDELLPKALSWLIKGVHVLDLRHVEFSFRTAQPASPAPDPQQEEKNHG